MLSSSTAAGIALAHLDRLDHYRVGADVPADRAVCERVRHTVARLPWYSGLPVRGLLWIAGGLVFLRTGTTLDRVAPPRRARLAEGLLRVPLFPMVDKLLVTVTYLHAFDEQPLPDAGPD